jgi:hypothetical protein
MAFKLQEHLPSWRYPLRMIQCINQYFYEEFDFSGNNIDYYDPRNSFFNDVIERRTGIPITLALVYMEADVDEFEVYLPQTAGFRKESGKGRKDFAVVSRDKFGIKR